MLNLIISGSTCFLANAYAAVSDVFLFLFYLEYRADNFSPLYIKGGSWNWKNAPFGCMAVKKHLSWSWCVLFDIQKERVSVVFFVRVNLFSTHGEEFNRFHNIIRAGNI